MYVIVDGQDAADRIHAFGLSVGVLTVTHAGVDSVEVIRSDGTRHALRHPEVGALGLISSQPAAAAAKAIQAWWAEDAGTALDVFALGKGGGVRAAVAEWLLEKASASTDTIAVSMRDAVAQNAQLRASYDAIQFAFAEVENFVGANRLAPAILQYSAEHIGSFWRPVAPTLFLRQSLPILADRIGWLELYFQKAAKPAEGVVEVKIWCEPSGTVIIDTQLAYADIETGWIQFEPCSGLRPHEETVVQVAWSSEGSAQSLPAIGLTSPLLLNDHSVLVTASGACRGLVAKLWATLPGIRPPISTMLHPPATNNRTVGLVPTVLADFVELGSDLGYVVYRPLEGRLQTHPQADETTAAILTSPVPAAANRVSVDARTLNPDASPIQYRIGLAPSEEAVLSLLQDSDAPNQSGWVTVMPNAPVRIGFEISEGMDTAQYLYFATRLPDTSNAAFGWATWGSVEFVVES